MARTDLAPTFGQAAAARGVPRFKVGEGWRNAFFVLPFVAVYAALLVYPLFNGMWISLHKGDMFGMGRFVGLANYERLFADKFFLTTVWNTFVFVLMTVPAFVVLGMALAMALNRQTRTAAALRAIFFGTSVLSVAIVALIWRVIFIPDRGLLTNVLGWLGQGPIDFLNNPDRALPAIAIATVWWGIGLPMMLFLAALQQIPRELYEAAALDNASRWRSFWKITLPSIRRTLVLVIIIQIVLQFQVFGQAQLMTKGGPNNASRPIVLFIYETGFKRWDIGYAAAASEVLFGLILIAALVQYLVSRKRGEA